jgi:hypothetical protein
MLTLRAHQHSWALAHRQPLVSLYAARTSALLTFGRHNMLGQLVLPHVAGVLAVWSLNTGVPLGAPMISRRSRVGSCAGELPDDAVRSARYSTRRADVAVLADPASWRMVHGARRA